MENNATTLPRTNRQTERRFFMLLASLIALFVFAGFARTYYLRPLFMPAPLTPLVHLHGLVFTLWVILLIVQTQLVAAGRADIHRRLGVAGIVLAALMEVFGILVPLAAAKDGDHLKGMTVASTMAIQLMNTVTFPILFGAAIYFRRQPAMHKRLMLLASLAIMSPAYVRILRQCCTAIPVRPVFIAYLLVDLTVLALFVYDWRTQGRIHRATLWGGLLVLIAHPLRFWLGTTSMWESIANWLVTLI
ncbi:MAG TPA: hypothetical protein PLK30_22765 [Blastocatellia bacterium]|nr:hypothetical protein [Blastocatellia bacterium]